MPLFYQHPFHYCQDNLFQCEHMLVALNSQTWTCGPNGRNDALARELEQAMKMRVHLVLCDEFPSLISGLAPKKDGGFRERHAEEFEFIMEKSNNRGAQTLFWLPAHLLAR